MPAPVEHPIWIPRGSDTANLDLSIVVPAFNEQDRIGFVLDSLARLVRSRSAEIIVVDDGSSDNTRAIAESRADSFDRLVVISHERNLGKGAAVRSGVVATAGDVVGFVDADDATDLVGVDAMIDELRQHPTVGAVFGSRHLAESTVSGSPIVRGLMGQAFNQLVRFAAGTNISDTQCGAKVFRGPLARLVFAGSQVDGFAFDVEILRSVLATGFEVVEYPVVWKHVTGSKIRPLTPVRMFVDIARLRLRPIAPMLGSVVIPLSETVRRRADPLAATNRQPPVTAASQPGSESMSNTIALIGDLSRTQSLLDELGVAGALVTHRRTWPQARGASPS